MSSYKDTANKARLDLISPYALGAIADVFGYGAKKYGEKEGELNYDKNPCANSEYYAAALRHLNQYHKGLLQGDSNALDSESSLSHIAHAASNLIMLLHNLMKDDVPSLDAETQNLQAQNKEYYGTFPQLIPNPFYRISNTTPSEH